MDEEESKADFVKRLGLSVTIEWSSFRIPFVTGNLSLTWKCTLKRTGHQCAIYIGTGLYFQEKHLDVLHVLQYMAECEHDTLYDARADYHAICQTASDRTEADCYLAWFALQWKRFERFFGEDWHDYRKIYLEGAA